MSGGWLDIQGPAGSRREALLEGLTRIGGAGLDVVLTGTQLSGPSDDQLHVWNRPPRVLFLGRGARPLVHGLPFEEHALKPGDRIEWAAHTLVYGGEAAPADLATLEELEPSRPSGETPLAAAGDARLVARVRAGLACELGLADPAAAKRWREAVLAEKFDPDACARELLARPLGPEAEQRLLERSGTLLRDFLMAALLAGAAGAARRLRQSSRSLVAFVLTQLLALVVFAALVGAALLLMRSKGTSIDAFLDRILPG